MGRSCSTGRKRDDLSETVLEDAIELGSSAEPKEGASERRRERRWNELNHRLTRCGDKDREDPFEEKDCWGPYWDSLGDKDGERRDGETCCGCRRKGLSHRLIRGLSGDTDGEGPREGKYCGDPREDPRLDKDCEYRYWEKDRGDWDCMEDLGDRGKCGASVSLRGCLPLPMIFSPPSTDPEPSFEPKLDLERQVASVSLRGSLPLSELSSCSDTKLKVSPHIL